MDPRKRGEISERSSRSSVLLQSYAANIYTFPVDQARLSLYWCDRVSSYASHISDTGTRLRRPDTGHFGSPSSSSELQLDIFFVFVPSSCCSLSHSSTSCWNWKRILEGERERDEKPCKWRGREERIAKESIKHRTRELSLVFMLSQRVKSR